MSRLRIFTLLISFFIFFIPQFLFADKDEAAKLYEDAVVRINENDTKGAIIQLKNVLKYDPDMLPARVLLGKSYLHDGQPGNAESELKEANRLGADPALTLPSLAKAYLLQFKYQTLIKLNTTNLPREVQSELLVYRGHAYLEMNQLDNAELSFTEAEKLNPEMASPVSGIALVRLHQGKLAEARKMSDKALQLDADEASVWSVRASISHLEGNLEKALEQYRKVLELDKNDIEARLARVGIFLDLDKREEARRDLEFLREEYNFEPRSIYLQAVLLKREGDGTKALAKTQEAANILIEIDPSVIKNSRSLLMLSGLVFFDLKQFELAKAYLNTFVKKFPKQVGARKILGSILLSERQYEEGINVLNPAYKLAPKDPRVLDLLGNAYMQVGKADLAVELLEKAAVFSYEQADIRKDLALGYLSAGEQQLALTELTKLYEKDKSQQSGIVLALVYYKIGELEKALNLCKKLLEQESENTVFLNWMGSIEAASSKFSDARKHFQKAIALDPSFLIAQINLGKLLLAEGKLAEARKHYLAILDNHPEHIATIMELSRVYELEANLDKAIQWMNKALRLDKKLISTRLYLVRLYIRSGQAEKALALAEKVVFLAPENMDARLAVVSSALAAGKPGDARFSLKKMKDIALTDAESLFRIARVEKQAGFLKSAITTMTLSLHYRPNYLPAQIILTDTLLQDGQTENAYEWALKIKDTNPELATSYRLMGDVFMKQSRPEEAAKEYVEAFSREPDTNNTLNLYLALEQSGANQKGINLLEDWLKTNPEDHQARYVLAQANLQLGQLTKAQQNLEWILKDSPEQPLLLNNLANLYALTHDPRALETIKKALKLLPEDPAINDTMGWLLVQDGDAKQGLRYLREAHYRKGDDPEIRYHIAVALYKLGRNSEALKELNATLKTKQDFNGIKEARKLQAQLKH